MDTLVASHSNLISKVNIGSTYENRPMYVLKVNRSYAYKLRLQTDIYIPLSDLLYIYNASSSALVERKNLQSGLMLESMRGSGFLLLLQCGLLTGWVRLLKNYTFSVCFNLFVIVHSELSSYFSFLTGNMISATFNFCSSLAIIHELHL